MEERFNRFKDAPWFPREEVNIIVGGAGGIGSWLCLLLARAGFRPMPFDFDLFEAHNMGGQFCKRKDVGKRKVDALQENVSMFCDGFQMEVFGTKFDSTTWTHKWMMSGFDNITARTDMFESWVKNHGDDPEAIYIDGRLNVEQLQIFCVKGGPNQTGIATYREQHLFAETDVAEQACTFKQTSHSAAMIAAHMTGFFTNHLTNVYAKADFRSVPFYWEYFIPMDFLTTN